LNLSCRITVFTQTGYSAVSVFSVSAGLFVCLSLCLFLHNVTADQAVATKHDTETPGPIPAVSMLLGLNGQRSKSGSESVCPIWA